MAKYMVAINVHNEANRVQHVFEMISKQTLLPDLLVWIDDGSTDNTIQVIESESKKFPRKVRILKAPKKSMPNYDTIGVAWNHVFPEIKSLEGFDYLMITDADSSFPHDYAEKIINFMESHKDVGVASGTIPGEERKRMPQNAGKIIRWRIVESIDRFWDLVPDTFWNIKAISMGYRISIRRDLHVHVPPSAGFSRKGRFRYGRIMYYVGRHPLLVILQALSFQLSERTGGVFLKGYFTEMMKGTWRCEIPEIRSFYSFTGMIRWMLVTKPYF